VKPAVYDVVVTDSARASKAFFSEEKKQKTCMTLSRIYPGASTQKVKDAPFEMA
jgi:hypothetical protein